MTTSLPPASRKRRTCQASSGSPRTGLRPFASPKREDFPPARITSVEWASSMVMVQLKQLRRRGNRDFARRLAEVADADRAMHARDLVERRPEHRHPLLEPLPFGFAADQTDEARRALRHGSYQVEVE